MTFENREARARSVFRGSVALYVPVVDRGGAEAVMLRLATAFVGKGLKVWLVVHHRAGSLMPMVPTDVEVVDLGVSASLVMVSANLGAILPLCRFLRDHRPDILMTPFPHANLVAVMARRLANAPTRVVLSEHAPLDAALAGHRPWRRAALQRLIGWLYPSAAAVVTVSQGVKRTVMALGVPGTDIHVLANPVLGEDFDSLGQQAVDHPWFRDPSRPVVIGVGRLSPEKDFATLVRAFARLREVTGARLVIVGEGWQRAHLEEIIADLGIADDVWLAGYQANPCAMISKSRVLVSSSCFEGFSLVVVEALACGCPVVATRTAGVGEILEDGRYGRMVPVGDHDAMAAAIAATLAAPPDPALGRSRAGIFTVERSAAAYLALFNRLCRRDADA